MSDSLNEFKPQSTEGCPKCNGHNLDWEEASDYDLEDVEESGCLRVCNDCGHSWWVEYEEE